MLVVQECQIKTRPYPFCITFAFAAAKILQNTGVHYSSKKKFALEKFNHRLRSIDEAAIVFDESA